MKTNLAWFSHPADMHRDPRFLALRQVYGLEGCAQYWILLERVALSPNAELDLKKRWDRGALEIELGMSARKLDEFLGFLNSEDIEMIELEDGILTVSSIREDFNKAETKRQRDRNRQRGASDSIKNANGKEKNESDSPHTLQDNTDNTDSTAQRARAELSPGEEEALRAFALGWAKKQRGIGNPEGFARKRWHDPDVVAAWRKSLEPPPPPVEPPPPVTPDEIAAANEEADQIMREAMARPGLGQALSGAAGPV